MRSDQPNEVSGLAERTHVGVNPTDSNGAGSAFASDSACGVCLFLSRVNRLGRPIMEHMFNTSLEILRCTQ